MSNDLTFAPVEFRAEVFGDVYDVETVSSGEWWAWFFPRGGRAEEILDPRGNNWPTRDAAIEACHKHHALRSGASVAPAGPVSVDADGAPV